jgi:peptidoglycan hydrolase-like protein with peptidoglycan-binding domain
LAGKERPCHRWRCRTGYVHGDGGLYELVLLKQGTRSEAVERLQEKHGIGADGQFGSGTEKALRDYQEKNGLLADGMADTPRSRR